MKKITAAFFLFLSCLSVYGANTPKPLALLAELTEMPGAPGFEKPVRQLLEKTWQPSMSTLKIDRMGNLIGAHINNQQGPRLLLSAHMDEVSLMVESISEDGFLRVIPLGGLANAVVFAQRWQVNTAKGPILAYSGMDAPHSLFEEKQAGSPPLEALFLDIGARSKKEAEEQFAVRPGLSVTAVSELTALGSNRYLAKALDDRLGLAAITDTLQIIKKNQQPNQLYLAASVQEEVGLRGASVLYENTHADVVVNVEVGIADDYPKLRAKRKNHIQLGKGPCIFVYDRSMIPNQELLQWVLNLAEKNHIPVQLETETGYGEDAAKLQISGQGVPAINLGIPVRYAHQHAGVFDAGDYQQMVKLLSLIVAHMDGNAVKQFSGHKLD